MSSRPEKNPKTGRTLAQKGRAASMNRPSDPVSAFRQERRAKREARRIRQREENVRRAETMHAARLAWEQEAKSAEAARFSAEHRAHVGCSGWFYWHWRGRFYPSNLPTANWFSHYAARFHTVELNAPFYSWPTTTAVCGWLRQAGRRKFVYTVKVSELITHVKRFVGTKILIRDFGHIADLLGPRMGCFLFQLPPSFHYTPARLHLILSQLDARRPAPGGYSSKSACWSSDGARPANSAAASRASDKNSGILPASRSSLILKSYSHP
jgi:hypothetical protein